MANAFARRCSECGGSLAGKSPQAKTCGDSCRSARSRRKARTNHDDAALVGGYEHNEQMFEVARAVRNEVPEIAHKVIAEEMRPVVREAMTEDVLRSIHSMVALTPAAVRALSEDLESDDPVIRNKATTLVLKYTVGHPSLVRPDDADPGKQLVVNLNLPRPELPPSPGSEAQEVETVGDAEEVRTCDKCGDTKLATLFAADSFRCLTCWETQREEVEKRFGVD